MIGQISASNQLRTSCELAPNMFGASSELASVMEFGFNAVGNILHSRLFVHRHEASDFSPEAKGLNASITLRCVCERLVCNIQHV